MKNINNTIPFVLPVACLAALLFAGSVSAQILRVSSVTVDTVWNSDSSWNDGNGMQQQRTSRDCRIIFTPQGEGVARMFIAMSIDSGKTWAPPPDPLSVMDNALDSVFITGQKATITVRVPGGDQPGTVFKMTARQAAPIIAGSPKTVTLGLAAILTPGQNVGVSLGLRLPDATPTDGYCTLSKVYWDALGDGTINDSTMGANALAWTWLTQVPAGTLGQKRSVIARAVDKNGLWSVPETLSVRFGAMVDTVTDIDGNVYHTVKIGAQEWTMENLRVTKYNDGSPIRKDTSAATWGNDTTPKYCFYSNTAVADSIRKFGALYSWYAVNTGKLAPAGWHVPSDSEWTVLETWLIANNYNWDGTTTGNKIAKALAGLTDWFVSTTPGAIGNDLTGNNSSGFSALPGGNRHSDGTFNFQGSDSYWWSATEFDALNAWFRSLQCDNDVLFRSGMNFFYTKSAGFSVRLVRD